MQAKADMGGFVSYAEKMTGQKCESEVESFFDHFSQAALFWNSQSDPEQTHIVKAFRFELGKVEVPAIRERMVGMLAQVDQYSCRSCGTRSRTRSSSQSPHVC